MSEDPRSKSQAVREALTRAELYRAGDATGNFRFRIAVEPFALTRREWDFLSALGPRLLAFYRAVNQLYFDSISGRAPAWVARYLDVGKPETVVECGRMNRFKRQMPGVIRPDLIPTRDGMIATELDAVPGGIGLTAALSAAYAQAGASLPDPAGLVTGFERMIRAHAAGSDATLAIVVSEESRDYRPEMAWLAEALTQRGLCAVTLAPSDVSLTDAGLWMQTPEGRRRIDVLYRFFELFDLKNVPKSEIILYAAKKGQVALTPPPKAYLEEKSAFALFHHPALSAFWRGHLGDETHTALQRLFPKTWMLDPTPIPPHAILPGLALDGVALSDLRALGAATQRARHLVIKPSGFSSLAWGSRGVAVGHDLSETAWREALDQALAAFHTTPHILQEFHKGKKVTVAYDDPQRACVAEMEGRVRLSPYYFVAGNQTHLGGVLATVCPTDKKCIHGMPDAVMAPCIVVEGDVE